jgi:hypothetical protein
MSLDSSGSWSFQILFRGFSCYLKEEQWDRHTCFYSGSGNLYLRTSKNVCTMTCIQNVHQVWSNTGKAF